MPTTTTVMRSPRQSGWASNSGQPFWIGVFAYADIPGHTTIGRLRPPDFGSSSITGESGSDIEEEVVIVSESICHTLDDLDLVIDAFEETGVQRPAAGSEDTVEIWLQALCEGIQGRDGAFGRPCEPRPPGGAGGLGVS